jgi:hypothetical protein
MSILLEVKLQAQFMDNVKNRNTTSIIHAIQQASFQVRAGGIQQKRLAIKPKPRNEVVLIKQLSLGATHLGP